MARLFLTNIDLNTNELQNAVVQNLSSAPTTGNKEGRIYYNITNKALYLYTDGQWKPLASGGAATSQLELTGDVTGSASVDATTGKITLETTVVNNSVALGDDTTGDYVQQVHGTSNQISVDYESGEGVTATISLPSTIEVSNLSIGDGVSSVNFTSGDITFNPDGNVFVNSDLYVNNGNKVHAGSIKLGGSESETDGAIQLQDYNGENLFTVVADGNLNGGTATATIKGQIDVYNPGPFGNKVGQISGNVDNNLVINATNSDLILNADSGNVIVNDNLITNTILSKNSTEDTLYIVSDQIVMQSPDVEIGGGGTNGKLQVLNSSGANAFVINGSTKEAQFGGNVTIDGNLNVEGTLNAVNRTEVNIEDNTIRLNTGYTGAPSADAGIIVERGTGNDTAIIWNESNDQWTLTNDGSNYYAIARKYVEVVGDASNTSFDVVHNLGTRDITVMVRENNAEYNVVETDILMKDGNTVTIGFTDAPALNSYKVIIVG